MLRRLIPPLLAVAFLPTALDLRSQAPSQGQSASPASRPSDAQTKISVNSDLVILPVTVKNQFGELVPDLEESDFRIFDDNVEQSVDVFTAESFPLSLVILIDDDLKSKEAAQMAPTLRAITAGISDNDEAMVCRFDLDFYPGDSFSGDLDKLWADLKNVQDKAGPSTAAPAPFVGSPSDHPLGVGEPQQNCSHQVRGPPHQSPRRRHPFRCRVTPRPRPRPPQNYPRRFRRCERPPVQSLRLSGLSPGSPARQYFCL